MVLLHFLSCAPADTGAFEVGGFLRNEGSSLKMKRESGGGKVFKGRIDGLEYQTAFFSL